MKSCPTCMRVFSDDAGFCPADGTSLRSASTVPVAMTGEDPRLGTRLCNRYELRRVVADGGMGRVYEGIDKETNTRIAVKVLHDDVSRDEVSLERFKREYEISSQLPHEYIVKVLDFQKDPSGVWLLVMEFLEGEELRFILKKEKLLEPARLIRMLSQTAIGLDDAHARQFVHRDLKPDNIFQCGTREGANVKLLDFGSVKDKNKDAKKLTVLGTTIGSPYYMAPEQAQGLETLDARADVFALAAITYECITGTVPFTGSNGPSILLAILTKDPEPPSVAARNAKYLVPAAMDDVIEGALAKNPAIRTKSIGALADAVGHAYGLTGSHLAWARTPTAELASMIDLAPKPTSDAAWTARDPFAAPDPFAPKDAALKGKAGGTLLLAAVGAQASVQVVRSAPPAADAPRPRAQANAHGDEDGRAAGLPGQRPSWFVPLLVGIAALAVGGGIAFVALSR